MIKINILLAIIFFTILFLGCSSDYPSNSLKEEQYEIINQNVKKAISEDYSAINFLVIEEGFTDTEEKNYLIKITFDLNKPYLLFEGKRIPSELKFVKNEEEDWICTYNSVSNALSVLGLIQGR